MQAELLQVGLEGMVDGTFANCHLSTPTTTATTTPTTPTTTATSSPAHGKFECFSFDGDAYLYLDSDNGVCSVQVGLLNSMVEACNGGEQMMH